MSFGGGGGGALQNHVHNSVPLQGGPLDFANDTISSMNAGSTTFSNGAALQELVIGNAGDSLVVNGAGTAPEWGVGAGASTELVGSSRLLAPATSMTVTFPAISGSDISNLTFYWTSLTSAGSPYSKPEITINGLTANNYKTEWIDQRAGTGTFATDTNTMITPAGGATTTARLISGMCTVMCGTAEQTTAGNDTIIQYFGTLSGMSPNFASWNFQGSYDDNLGAVAYDNFTEIKITNSTGNFETGNQLSVFRNNV